ncbi:hypothetical protein BV25DRAFT_1986740 [Artomyces pyxidatus]|uniref:Uncharacterized protein n=1 Tax=Artomyces pyxidatus TaxID=48021 RepID=A0ACB8TLJ4_9AGAM|nr:hypothetical protein BV25DRAFT_1986740 [Artomyces pyxidatus]
MLVTLEAHLAAFDKLPVVQRPPSLDRRAAESIDRYGRYATQEILFVLAAFAHETAHIYANALSEPKSDAKSNANELNSETGDRSQTTDALIAPVCDQDAMSVAEQELARKGDWGTLVEARLFGGQVFARRLRTTTPRTGESDCARLTRPRSTQ